MPSIDKIGPHKYKSEDGEFQRYSFLFFVIIDFCGDCSFALRESPVNFVKGANDSKPKVTAHTTKLNDGGKFTIKAKKKKNNGKCDKSIIYLDSPGVTIGGDVVLGGTVIQDYEIFVGQKGKKGLTFHAKIATKDDPIILRASTKGFGISPKAPEKKLK